MKYFQNWTYHASERLSERYPQITEEQASRIIPLIETNLRDRFEEPYFKNERIKKSVVVGVRFKDTKVRLIYEYNRGVVITVLPRKFNPNKKGAYRGVPYMTVNDVPDLVISIPRSNS